MDAILPILEKLHLNSTFYYQFVIFLVLYWIIKPLFISKLQFVIEQRAQQTDKKSELADEKMSQANTLSEEYHNKIDDGHLDANKFIFEQKKKIESGSSEIIFSAEHKSEKEFDGKMKEINESYNQRKNDLMTSVDSLSEDLIKKIT